MRTLAMIVLVAVICAPLWADTLPPVVGGKPGTTLSSLVGTDTLVTVVLKNRGAAHANLRVIEVAPQYVSLMTPVPENQRIPYMFTSIQEIRIQNGVVETKKLDIEDSRSLRAEEQRVIGRAFERAQEIYDNASADQSLKMQAAMVLAVNGDGAAVDYLQKLAGSNDVGTALDAELWLYRAGHLDAITPAIEAGFDSGDRQLRAKSAKLAGLIGAKTAIPALVEMLEDRNVTLCAPAAIALGRLGHKPSLDTILDMSIELNEIKGEAAVTALSIMGENDLVTRVRSLFDQTSGLTRFRLGRVLYNRNDPYGKKIFSTEIFDVPTLTPTVSLILAADGNFDAMQYLRNRLGERYNETEENMMYRAKAAVALIEGGDLVAASELQELLRSDNLAVKKHICSLMAELGRRRLIPLTQPVIESTEPELVLDACTAAVAMAKPSFCERIRKANQ